MFSRGTMTWSVDQIESNPSSSASIPDSTILAGLTVPPKFGRQKPNCMANASSLRSHISLLESDNPDRWGSYLAEPSDIKKKRCHRFYHPRDPERACVQGSQSLYLGDQVGCLHEGLSAVGCHEDV